MTNPNYDCSRVVEIEDEPRHHLVIANEYVRTFAVEVGPHERTLCHHHPNDYLIYVASAAEIISAARDEEPKRLNYADGECELSRAGLTHVVENLGDQPFRNVVVELLAAASTLRRGLAPQKISGDAEVRQVFDDMRAAIFEIEVEPGAELAVAGPAVVASPYGNELTPDALGDVEVKHNSICDLAWIAADREATLFGCWKQAVSLLVFRVGSTEANASIGSVLREPLKSLCAHAKEE